MHIADYYQMKWENNHCIAYNLLRLGYRAWADGTAVFDPKGNNLYGMEEKMSDVWLDIAWINCNKAIVHGYVEQVDIEFVLTDEQRELVYDLNARHEAERIALLKGFIND